jgi:hypothetical protein
MSATAPALVFPPPAGLLPGGIDGNQLLQSLPLPVLALDPEDRIRFVNAAAAQFLGVAPLGVGTLVLLLVYAVALSQRRVFVGQPFLIVWWGFMVIAAGAMAVGWLFASLVAGAALDPNPVIFAYLITLALYPAIADLFARAQRAFLRAV